MCSDCHCNDAVIDVRRIAPPMRHPMIFTAFESLAPGEAFLLVNDHDPRPLWYQFSARYPDTFDWAYEQQGPELWQVRVSRLAA